MRFARPGVRGPVTCLLATAGLIVGLVTDVVVHWRFGHDEAGLFDVRNPGHLLVGVSLGALAGAVTITLLDLRRSRRALAAGTAAALLMGVGGLGLGLADARVRDADAHTAADHDEAMPHTGHVGDEPDPTQLEQLRAAVDRYQDVNLALAHGYVQASTDDAMMGAHFGKDELAYVDQLDIAHPATLLYTQRLTGEWQLVGVGYSVSLDAYPKPPTEIAGAHWHQHRWTCVFYGDSFPTSVEPMTRRDCLDQGGEWWKEFGYELHVWTHFENPLGPFEDANPLLP